MATNWFRVGGIYEFTYFASSNRHQTIWLPPSRRNNGHIHTGEWSGTLLGIDSDLVTEISSPSLNNMSLLGKLFSGLPSTGTSQTRSPNSLDSHLEDNYTFNLLFPDAEALCHHDQVFPLSSGTVLPPAAVNAFDINGELDLEMRDVRVIIMQESTPASGSAYLLYDSHVPPPPSPSLDRAATNNTPAYAPREGRRSISSPRKTSLGQTSRPVIIQQDSSPRGFGGAFDRRPQHNKQLSYNETEGQRSQREYREEVSTFSNCIFGNSEVLAYKGTGTKVHILPSEAKPFTSGSYIGEGSLGRSSMRSSKLAQSFTSDNVALGPTSAGFTNTSTTSRGSDRKKVLITRMFPVTLPNDDANDAEDRTPMPMVHSKDAPGYPFPNVGDTGSPDKKKPQPKQKRTPMYAVGLVIHLPVASHAPAPASVPTSRSSFRAPGSYNEQDSFPSSFNSARSARRSGWTMLGHGFGVESLESSISSDVDDRIDTITQHWDIIIRTMSHLQAVATASLLPLLKQADLSSPEPRTHVRTPSASVSISGKRVEDPRPFKAPKTNAKLVQLVPNCLMQVQNIQQEVDASRQRIVTGIKACQVVTGQGRWGIWREEARLVGKWAGGKDEGFFFFNLLTGFLGNHTEWLQALGPSWYRRRHYQQQRSNKDDDISLPARTIIVSDNKLMARRLIFLLSAFLPANQQLASARLHRPSTSTSFGGFSPSPPTYTVPILREESLRRRMNKRASITRSTHSRTMSFPVQPAHNPEIHHHGRRPSDAVSIKTANLPIPGSDIGTRKSSAATTSTATPVTTIPHFSRTRPTRGTGPGPRPGSSGSLATDDLIRTLKRGDSTGHFSTASTDSQGQNSRWGSMISGFWGTKRRDSTATSSPPALDGVEIHDPHYKELPSQSAGKLAQMVEEANACVLLPARQQERELRKSESGSAETAKPESETGGDEVMEQRIQVNERIPDPSGAYESPVKTTISPSDGVIDIDVPLPEYLSFETAVSSPSSSGYSFSMPGIASGMEGFEHYSRTAPDADTTMNVGGWMPRYNPDFALQAIPRQADNNYLEAIKASLRAEPTPLLPITPHPTPRAGRWIEISSAIVADTTSFTIKHISYRRLIKPTPIDTSPSLPLDSRYGNPYAVALLTPSASTPDPAVEERFVEEPILAMDDTLIDAVERIIAHSSSDANSSTCSSRSTSRKPAPHSTTHTTSTPKPTQTNTDAPTLVSPAPANIHARSASASRVPERNLEVPRNECKKMVLSALEEIVRSVVDSREREGGEGGESGRVGREREREKESFLREGVRAWLGEVECDG